MQSLKYKMCFACIFIIHSNCFFKHFFNVVVLTQFYPPMVLCLKLVYLDDGANQNDKNDKKKKTVHFFLKERKNQSLVTVLIYSELCNCRSRKIVWMRYFRGSTWVLTVNMLNSSEMFLWCWMATYKDNNWNREILVVSLQDTLWMT